MSPNDNERRYSDEEFALILRTAAEVETGPEVAPPRTGLTLAEIKEIAAEVGIDPNRVAKAAALLPSSVEDGLSRLIGGHPRHRLEHTVPVEVSSSELGRLLDLARREMDTQGETREVLGGLEWQGGTSTTSVRVAITPREGETVLQASTDRTEAMAGILAGVTLPVGGVIAVTLGKLVFGETDAGILAALVSGLAPAFLFARSVWKRSTRRWRERLFQLMDAMAREVEAAPGFEAESAAYGERPGESGAGLPGPPDS